MSRPTNYTPELDSKICERIAAGESLSQICRDDDMPHRDTVYEWKGKNQAFSDRYARAVEDRAENLASEIVEISDESAVDPTSESVAAARLKVDARKWIASKLFPRKYGDKVQTEHSGPDGKPISVSITFVRPTNAG